MRQKIVAGNWKMNGDREAAFILASEIAGMSKDELTNDITVIVAPPFVHISAVVSLLKGTKIKVAAQNCSSETQGAYTGEIAASMIKSVGADYVIIGHSERRHYFEESNEQLSKKVMVAIENKLTPIFCVGETLPQREAGEQEQIVGQQLRESLFHLDGNTFSKLILAYEPVWAIGTGKTATSQQAEEMHHFIRDQIKLQYDATVADKISILYGGSCNEKNAKELFSMPNVDGGLIGGASLKSRSFVNIILSF